MDNLDTNIIEDNTQSEYKQNKFTRKKATKMSNRDPTKTTG
jgi:hypothetical protein